MEDNENVINAEIVSDEEETEDNENLSDDAYYNESEYVDKQSFDWDNFLYYAGLTLDALSKLTAFLSILVILSYPLIHIINIFFHIDKFMKILPIGYVSSIKIENLMHPIVAPITMILFGLICFIIASKLMAWLTKNFSITSRIVCIFTGITFVFFMISKEANDLLLKGLESAGNILAMIVVLVVFFPVGYFLLYISTPFGKFSPEPSRFLSKFYGPLANLFKVTFND